MSETLGQIRSLVRSGDVEVSRHGLLELTADGIRLSAVTASIDLAVAVEDYPDAQRGPTVLALQRDEDGSDLHVFGAYQKVHQSQRC